ncbi:uncharacterized protein LOC124897885 [Capsicum annuum]|uniref:uncharacterized protein LOC124897885 n=1 Tax=Capsicum annuum TaxID=4072 RepID=UPI001FB0D9DF|nr:uncharacterized protein LOC124897885 [Capsicum annuum]
MRSSGAPLLPINPEPQLIGRMAEKPEAKKISCFSQGSGSRDTASTSFCKMSMEDMMKKLLKGVKATNSGVTNMETITTWSGKLLSRPSMGKAVEKEVSVDQSEGKNLVESEKVDGFVDMSEKEDNKKEEVDLLTKKRKVSSKPVDNIHHCSAVSSQSLVQKKPDPGAFTIPCTVGSIKFTEALCDLGESINLVPFEIYKKLGLGDPTPTMIYFVILDCDVDFEVPIILGIPLLSTGRILVNMELNELKFRYGKKEARIKMQPPTKQLEEMNIFSIVDVFHGGGNKIVIRHLDKV